MMSRKVWVIKQPIMSDDIIIAISKVEGSHAPRKAREKLMSEAWSAKTSKATLFTCIPGINPVIIPKPEPMSVKSITANNKTTGFIGMVNSKKDLKRLLWSEFGSFCDAQ